MNDLPTERPVQAPSRRTRVVAAIGAPMVALAASLALLRQPGTPFLFFYPAVAVAAWYGGVSSGIVAGALSVFLADYFFIVPTRVLTVPTGGDTLIVGVFFISAIVISRVSGVHRVAQTKADLYTRQLAARADELQAELEAGQRLTEELETTNEELSATNEELAAANEHEAQRGHLFTLAASLARAVTPDDVAAIVFREGLAAADASAGSMGLVVDGGVGGRHVTLLHSVGYAEETTAAYHDFPLVPGRPVSDAIISGTPVLIGSLREWEVRYPSTYPAVVTLGYESFAAVPVMIAGNAVAAISFSFRAPRAFNDSTVAFLETLASVSGQALERARAFDAEHRARERATLIVESVTDGFVALDPELRFTYVNRRAAELWRRPAESIVGRTPREAFADIDGIADSPTLAAFARVLADRTPVAIETFSVAIRRWIELRAYPSGEGGIVAFFQDITARRRAQDASSFLADASQLLGSSTNYRETLTNLARAAVPRLGDWCAVDVLRDPSDTQWPPLLDRVAVVHEDPARIALGAELTAAYPTDWSQERGIPGVIRTGTPFYIPDVTDAMLVAGAKDARHLELLRALQFRSIMAVPLVARDQVLGAMTLCMSESGRIYDDADLALAEDLARRAGAAVDAARLLRDAELANAAKTEFLRTISHELRQPINATISFLQLWELGVRGPLDAKLRDDLERVQRNQRHLQRLIEDLLSFTRLDAGKLTIIREPVVVKDVIASLESIMASQMQEANLEFEIATCPADLRMLGDQGRVVQIGVNLLTNALRATKAGGRVRLECVTDGEATAMVVSDTGIGIPADRLDHIFSPFTQLGRALDAPKEGAGLGLAISRGLAEVMGGSLTATSAVGIGSTFVLRLPAVD